eukprot:m.468748 g.468748  ORF g.468748 m.468748 type:complete len:420 (+) comp21647_c0_seq2:137-1396(+)
MWNCGGLRLRSLALSAIAGAGTATWIGNIAAAAPKAGPSVEDKHFSAESNYSVNTDNDTFHKLAVQNDVKIGPVSLRQGQNGRGLFADSAISEGTLLIRVPLDLCLIHQHGDDKTQDRDWPFWLATRVLRETSATDEASADSRAKFWPVYSKLFLPSIEEATATIPAAMPLPWIEKFRHWGIMQQLYIYRMQSQKKFKEITGKDTVPEALTWAQSLVLSRCFGLSKNRGTITLIPFIDMLNHADPGNTKLRLDADRRQVYAYASKDIGPGEEICTCYTDKAPNALLFMKFGFVAKNNPNWSILMGASERKNLINPNRLMEFLDETTPGWDRRSDKQLVAILDALPVDEVGNVPLEVETSGMGKLSELLHRRAQRIRQDVAEGEMGPLHVLADETLSILDRATTTIAAYKAWLEKTASAK